MNENQVENLLSRHGDEILTRRPVKISKRRQVWKPVLVTGTAIVAIGAFLLMPRNAEAARVQGMRKALKGVRSMEYWGDIRYNGNAWNQYVHQIRQDGLVWAEISKSRAQKMTYISDQIQVMMDWERLPFATISQENTDEFYGQDDPLKIAIANYAGTSSPNQYDVRSADTAPIGGRPTYTLSYSSKTLPSNSMDLTTKDKQSFQIIVDSNTNLPIESTYQSDSNGVLGEIKYRYAYNKSYPDKLFSMKSNKPLLYPDIERQKISKEWAKAKKTGNHAPIYSSSISPEGTIWLAYGSREAEIPQSVPSELIAPNGVKFVRGFERSYTWQSNNKELLTGLPGLTLTPFIPVYNQATLPSSIQVRFTTRIGDHADAMQGESFYKTISLSKENWNIPSYFPAFHLGRDMLSFPIEFWKKRADARKDFGDTLEAAKAFEQEAGAYKNFVEYAGYKPLIEAADCYEKLGELDKAKELRAKAAELQKTRVR
jgi:hypothetical protein